MKTATILCLLTAVLGACASEQPMMPADVPLSEAGRTSGEAHLALIDKLVATAENNRGDCDAMAGALGRALSDTRDMWQSLEHTDELNTHFRSRAEKQLRGLWTFVYPCADNTDMRDLVIALQKGQLQ